MYRPGQYIFADKSLIDYISFVIRYLQITQRQRKVI